MKLFCTLHYLTAYVAHKSSYQFPHSLLETEIAPLMFAWDPAKVADSAKKTPLSRQVGPEKQARLAVLNALCPDKVFRLGGSEYPDLVVGSFGERLLKPHGHEDDQWPDGEWARKTVRYRAE